MDGVMSQEEINALLNSPADAGSDSGQELLTTKAVVKRWL